MINVTQTFLPELEEFNGYLKKIWESKRITNRGPAVVELEARLCSFLGIEKILTVNTGTVALQIAIKALGLSGEIITTPFSYVATVSSIVWENCTPVFVDIDRDYLTIDETKIEAAITDKTTAILVTHVYGNPCNVEVIQDIAKRNNLKIIYDAAHCFGVRLKGRSILQWGDVSTLSFHATKVFHTGEGGAIVCNDRALADKIYYHHNFGHDGPDAFFGLGINAKLSELNGAMGLTLLPHISKILEKRREVCERYDELFSGSALQTLNLREGTEWNYSYYPVIFPTEKVLLDTQAAMHAADIFPRRYFYPSLNCLPYVAPSEMRIAEDVSRRIMCLPLSTELDTHQIELISSIALKYV